VTDFSKFEVKDGPVRKYATEFALNMVGNPVVFTQQQNLDDLSRPEVAERLQEEPCHIYMICRRPRISINPESFVASATSISLEFIVHSQDAVLRFPTTAENGFGTADLTLNSTYPHNLFVINDANGKRLRAKSGLMAANLRVPGISKYLDLEVLYVGQAYGNDGSRTAPDRLKSHATLQAIYAEALAQSPDKEIWLILWSFSPMLISSIDGRWNKYLATNEEDDEHAEKVMEESITDQQKINFVEAALIKYFKPSFNVMFKNKFPSPAHATYSKCYELDLNHLIVELNTEHISAKIFSETVPPEWHHTLNFNLHSLEERRSMFSVLIPEGYEK